MNCLPCVDRRIRLCLLVVLVSFSFFVLPGFGAPMNGLAVPFTQPDGTVITLAFFGDEFYARAETEDGYTVFFDSATKTYCYADLSADGNEFVSTGKVVGKANPDEIGVAKGLKINAASRAAKARKRYEVHETIVKQRERWEAVKAANRNYRAFKQEVRKQEEAGKKGFVIPMGTIFPDSEIEPAPAMSAPAEGDVAGVSSDEPVALASPGFTLGGDVLGLSILVDFSDAPGTVVTQTQVDDYCNKPNYTEFGNAGSIYDYFFIQSGGHLRYHNKVTYYVRVPHPKTYYNVIPVDPNNLNSTTCGSLLLRDALDVLIADGYDFSDLTTRVVSGKNYVRACNVFFAGANSGAWGQGLWPHSSAMPEKLVGPNMYISDYQITEIGTSANLKIGTFAHENGHMLLGYPDLYSYDGNAANFGSFSLMGFGNDAGGGKHPTSIDAYLKTASGWMDIVDLDSTSHQRYTLQVDGNQIYRYPNPADAREYFMFDVRGNTGYEGPYGGSIQSVNPTAGLVVYHAKENGSSTHSSIFTALNPNNDYSTPYELLLVEANQLTTITPWYDAPTPDANDAFKASGKNQISDTTTPALKFWDATGRNTASGAVIHSISADGPVMTFVVGEGDPVGSPRVVLSRAMIKSYGDLGATAASQTFFIGNGGGETLNYTITENQTWLSCSPTSGTVSNGSDAITVNFTTSGLAAGSYAATITVSDPSVPTSATINVNLTVAPQAVMGLSINNISATALSGLEAPDIAFTINNTGGGAMTYSLSKTQSWLTLSPSFGTVMAETDTVYVSLDASALPSGTYSDTITITSDEALNAPQLIPVAFTVLDGPVAVVTPTNLFAYAVTGEVGQASVMLGNSGGLDLSFIISDDLPDSTAYVAVNSDAAGGPTYNWIDISALGSALPLGDDGISSLLDIGFVFPFYGSDYSQFQIGANGVVSLTTGDVNFANYALPSTYIPSASLAVFWDDLNPAAGGEIRYHATADRLVVSWLAVPRYGTTTYQTFQVVIYPDGRIVYQYHTLEGTLTRNTVGIQDRDGTGSALQLIFNDVYLKSSFAIAFTPPEPKWLSYPVSSGSVSPDASTSVWFYASASNLTEGVYTALVSIAMNDINLPQVDIPLVFSVSTVPVPRVDVSKTALFATEGGATDTYTLVLGTLPSNEVVIAVLPDIQVSVDKPSVTFTTGNWNQPQTITVTAVDDSDHELMHTGTIQHAASSADAGYAGIQIADVLVTITDNDNTAPTVNAGPDQTVLLTVADWSPIDANVSLWLDADDDATITLNGATVSQWADKSDFGRHATADGTSQPLATAAGLNGKRVLTFDGSNNFFSVDLNFLAGVSHATYIVTKPTSFSNIYGAASGNQGSNSLHVGFAGTNYRMSYWDHNYGPVLTANFVAGSANVINYVWIPGTGKQILANGKLEGNGNNAGVIGTMAGGGRIGRTTGHAAFGGDIAEIIMVTGTVSVAARERFEGYLAHKWGVDAYLPQGHTYKTEGPIRAWAAASLDGTVYDADDDPLSTLWTVVSGPGPVVFDNANAANTIANFSVEGLYTLRLMASDTVAQTTDDVVITVTTNAPPAIWAPSDLRATAVTSNRIDLAWTDNSTNETGFAIERSITSGSGFTLVGSVATDVEAYADTGLTMGETYYYRVYATNSTDSSAMTAEVSATTLKNIATVMLADLTQTYDGSARLVQATTLPAGLTVDVTYGGNAAAPTNAGSYAVAASINELLYEGATNGTMVVNQATPAVQEWPTAAPIIEGQALSNATLSGGSASVSGGFAYVNPTFTPPLGAYAAAVRFLPGDSINYGSVTGLVNVTVNEAPPPVPTGVTATLLVGRVDLNWAASSNATHYNVKRTAVSGGPYVVVGTPVGPSFSDTTVTNGSTYYYVVSAIGNGGESADSAEVDAVLLQAQPFSETFDGAGMSSSIGMLDGQRGWTGGSNTLVQSGGGRDDSNGLQITADGAVQDFANGTDVVTLDFWSKMVPGADPTPEALASNVTAVLWVDADNYIMVYSNKTVVSLPVQVISNAWNHFTVTVDYAGGSWGLAVNGTNAASGLGLYSAQTRFVGIDLYNTASLPAYFDDITVQGEAVLSSYENWLMEYFGTTSITGSEMSSNGVNTIFEAYIIGLDPTDPEGRFGVTSIGRHAGAAVLNWNSVSGRLYNVYWSSNLLEGAGFQLVYSNIFWNANTITDTVHGAENSGFYRIDVQLDD